MKTVWFLIGHGGMDHADYYWGLYRGYYRDPFPHSLLSTRQNILWSFIDRVSWGHVHCRLTKADNRQPATPNPKPPQP